MTSNKLVRFMNIAKTGAYIAFGCLSVLILIFPIAGIALAIESMFDPTPFNIYAGLGLICIIYLALYFFVKFIIDVYPWWRRRKMITRSLTAAVSLILIIVITTVSIVIPQRKNYEKAVNHFEVNWKINLPDDIKLKYSKSRSFGFVGGHDELIYAVFKFKNDTLNNELSKLIPNGICNLTSYNQWKIDGFKDSFPALNEKTYAKLYFEKLIKGFPMQIPKRFIPDWSNNEIQWGLHGAYVANYNHKVTDACLFVIFTPSLKTLVLYEFLVADH